MRLDSTTFSLQEILVLSNRCAAVLVIYPLQLLTTNRGGSIAPNFPNGVVSENLVLPNRCIFRKQRQRRAVRYHEVFWSVSFHKNWCYRIVELLRCCVIHCKYWQQTGRFDTTSFSEGLVLSNSCAAVLSMASTDNKEGSFQSTKASDGCRLPKFGAIEPLHLPTMRTVKGGSIAPHFLNGFFSGNLVLSDRCAAVLSIASLTTNRGGSKAPSFPRGSS